MVTTLRSGPGGIEHEFWRHRIKERCEARGYTVTQEYALGEGKRVDLHATRKNRRLFIEIETGKSDVQGNIQKCAGNNATLIMFFTSKQAMMNATTILTAFPDVVAVCPDTLNELHDILNATNSR